MVAFVANNIASKVFRKGGYLEKKLCACIGAGRTIKSACISI